MFTVKGLRPPGAESRGSYQRASPATASASTGGATSCGPAAASAALPAHPGQHLLPHVRESPDGLR